jgi:hypothetical protein
MTLGYFRIRRIIPPQLKTVPSHTNADARRKALSLYRLCLRLVKFYRFKDSKAKRYPLGP